MGLVELLEEIKAAHEKELKEAYDRGFADGLASVGSDKIFSQAELDAKIAEALAPQQAKVAELEKKIEDLTLAVDAAKVEAVAAFKAELAAKYEELQVIESQAETGFAELLK